MLEWLQHAVDVAVAEPGAVFLGLLIGGVIGYLVGLSSSRIGG